MARITEIEGDIFGAPRNSVLIHACNCIGEWGSGVALEFKKRYPHAYDVYHDHCLTSTSTTSPHPLEGTTLLIPPRSSSPPGDHELSTHWIACLFTSNGYGRQTKTKAGVSPPKAIVANTAAALRDLEEQLRELRAEGLQEKEGEKRKEKDVRVPGEIWSVRINSGSFRVPWEETSNVLKEGGLDMVIVRPRAEKGGDQAEPKSEKRRSADEMRGREGKRARRGRMSKMERDASESEARDGKGPGVKGDDAAGDGAAESEGNPLKHPRKKQQI